MTFPLYSSAMRLRQRFTSLERRAASRMRRPSGSVMSQGISTMVSLRGMRSVLRNMTLRRVRRRVDRRVAESARGRHGARRGRFCSLEPRLRLLRTADLRGRAGPHAARGRRVARARGAPRGRAPRSRRGARWGSCSTGASSSPGAERSSRFALRTMRPAEGAPSGLSPATASMTCASSWTAPPWRSLPTTGSSPLPPAGSPAPPPSPS